MTTHILSLTYAPKIPLVKSGECTQTIRLHNPDRPKKVGDKLILRTWAGWPYRTKWNWRLETYISELKLMRLRNTDDNSPRGWAGDAEVFDEKDKMFFSIGTCGYEELIWDDGVRSAWSPERERCYNPGMICVFQDLLRELNGIDKLDGTLWDIIRWPKPTIRRVE